MQKIGIVIPCYNEHERFPVAQFQTFLKHHQQYYFCLVDDGSSDATLSMLIQLEEVEERIQVIALEKNMGKAEAVRQGILNSIKWQEFELIGFIDADMATPLEEISHLVSYLNKQQERKYQVSVGSRVKRLGATIIRNPLRHYLGRIFATIVGLLFNLEVYDTQCGAKIFKAKIVSDIFQKPFVSTWIFDIEIFLRLANSLGGMKELEKMVIEVPLLCWKEKNNSKISLLYWLKAPLELIKIYKAYK